MLGHGRRRVIDFTGISQIWLREALKRWVAEELPTRRGDHATAILQDHVHRIEELSASLRLHRGDHGDDPRALGRGDIIAFLSRLTHRQVTGQMSSWRHSTTCRQVAMILRECRALGLTRHGQPMSGLPDDFAVRRDDIPQQAADDEPGRALPAGVLNQLITALPAAGTIGQPCLPGRGRAADGDRPPADRGLQAQLGLPGPGLRWQVRPDLHRLQSQPGRTAAAHHRRNRQGDHRPAAAGPCPLSRYPGSRARSFPPAHQEPGGQAAHRRQRRGLPPPHLGRLTTRAAGGRRPGVR